MRKLHHFLSGLPRSGSTVLAAILNQNPDVYVTPTSPMLDLLVANQNAWHDNLSVKANPFPEQLTNVTRAMIDAMWTHRPETIIIDKNRGWGKNMPASTILFEREIKILAMNRDLPSIMASWLTLLRKNPHSYMDRLLASRGLAATDANRMEEMWTNMVRDCMESLQQARIDAGNRLLTVDYDQLMQYPEDTLRKVAEFLELPPHQYQFDNIVNESQDNDMLAWGLRGMHEIRPKLGKISKDPKEILGQELYDKFVMLEKRYA